MSGSEPLPVHDALAWLRPSPKGQPEGLRTEPGQGINIPFSRRLIEEYFSRCFLVERRMIPFVVIVLKVTFQSVVQ